jgi:hypothetical protein
MAHERSGRFSTSVTFLPATFVAEQIMQFFLQNELTTSSVDDLAKNRGNSTH